MNPLQWPFTDLWRLMRPRGLVCVLLLPLAGFGWGHWDRALPVSGLDRLLPLLVAWAFLHLGTMWLNAALDRDEDAVVFGAKAVVPDSIELYSVFALSVGVFFGFMAGWVPGLCGLFCALLGFAYSYPALAWKGNSVAGPLVNLVGYGVLSPLSGWWVVGSEVSWRTLLTWFILVSGIMATYFGLQGYQEIEDRTRGYRTMVVTHGVGTTLAVSRSLIWIAGFTLILMATIGWYPRAMLLAIPGFFWIDRWVSQWAHANNAHEIQWAGEFVRRSFILGFGLFGIVVGVYLVDSWAGAAVAGLATIAGHP